MFISCFNNANSIFAFWACMKKSTNYLTLKEVENISENIIRHQLSSEMDKIGAIQSLKERQGGASNWIMDCSNGEMNSWTKLKRGLALFPRTNDQREERKHTTNGFEDSISDQNDCEKFEEDESGKVQQRAIAC